MKRRCSLVGAGMMILTLTAGCGGVGDLFESSVTPPKGTTPDTAGSAGSGAAASPEAPPSVTPSPPASAPGREGSAEEEGIATESPNPAPTPPAPDTSSEAPSAEQPTPIDEEPATEPEPLSPPTCELGEFGPLEKISGLGLSGPLWGPALTAADSILFFVATTDTGAEQIFFASRSDVTTIQFSAAVPLTELASNAFDGTPFVSASGLRLYFYSTREGSNGGSRDVWVAQRSTLTNPFGAPTPLVELNSETIEVTPRLSADELNIVFTSQRPGGRGNTDIWQARRNSADAPFGAPQNVAELNTEADDTGAWPSSDGLTVFFASNRAGGLGRLDIWRATRTSVDQPFGPAEVMPVVNSPSDELDFALASDERELLLSSDRDGVPELWRAVRSCQ